MPILNVHKKIQVRQKESVLHKQIGHPELNTVQPVYRLRLYLLLCMASLSRAFSCLISRCFSTVSSRSSFASSAVPSGRQTLVSYVQDRSPVTPNGLSVVNKGLYTRCCKSQPQNLFTTLSKAAPAANGHTPSSACHPTYSNAITDCTRVSILII